MRRILVALALLASCLTGNQATSGEVDSLNDGLAEFAQASYSNAIRKLTPLAERGNATAQLVLAKSLAAKDYAGRACATAKHWFRLSAEAGNAEASFELARLFQDTSCGTTNELAALRWYQQAYTGGFPEAATAIGEILLFDADYRDFVVEAHEWFLRGAEHLDGVAALRLAQMYQIGLAVSRDLSKAFSWYEIAERHLAATSHEQDFALLMRDSIREQFTPVQVNKLLEQARSWEAEFWIFSKRGS
jgi:uncharacterized protein